MSNDTVTEETPFVPDDDTYHEPTVDDPLWFETTWWSFSVPERRLGGWLHAGRHTNRGTVSWRVFVWDPSGADPGRLAYYRSMPDLPFDEVEGQSLDLRDIVFPEGGFSVKMLTPLMDYHVGYFDAEARFSVEFEHRSVHPPHRFTPGQAPALHNPHLDQLGESPWDLRRLSILDMKESNEFTQGFESAAVLVGGEGDGCSSREVASG